MSVPRDPPWPPPGAGGLAVAILRDWALERTDDRPEQDLAGWEFWAEVAGSEDPSRLLRILRSRRWARRRTSAEG